VDYYMTAGSVDKDSLLLFDATAGQVSNSSAKFTAPPTPGAQVLWAVVRDNRGGVSWVQAPLSVK
jgi:hypothetical protein